jgi:hypothetical protein
MQGTSSLHRILSLQDAYQTIAVATHAPTLNGTTIATIMESDQNSWILISGVT